MSRFMSLYPSSHQSKSENRPLLSHPRLPRQQPPYLPRNSGAVRPRTPGGFRPRFSATLPRHNYPIGGTGINTPNYTESYGTTDAAYTDSYADSVQEEYSDQAPEETHYPTESLESSYETDLNAQPEDDKTVFDYGHGRSDEVGAYKAQTTRSYGRARGFGYSRVHRAKQHTSSYRGRGDYQTSPFVPQTPVHEDINYTDVSLTGNTDQLQQLPGNRGRGLLPRPPRGRSLIVSNVTSRGRGRGNTSDDINIVSKEITSNDEQDGSELSDLSLFVQRSDQSENDQTLSSSPFNRNQSLVSSSSSAVVTHTSKSPQVSQASQSTRTSIQQSPKTTSSSSSSTNNSVTSHGLTVTVSSSITQNVSGLQPQVSSSDMAQKSQQGTSTKTGTQHQSESITVSKSSQSMSNDSLLKGNQQSDMISSVAQSLLSNTRTDSAIIKPKLELPPFKRVSPQSPQNKSQERSSAPLQSYSLKGTQPLKSYPTGGPTTQTSPYSSRQNEFSTATQHARSPARQAVADSTLPEQQQKEKKGENPDDETEEEAIDTGFCHYCNINFSNPDSYWKHTRGILHTQKLMEAEKNKQKEGEKFFKTETVDAGPKFVQRDVRGKKVLSREEKIQHMRDEIQLVTAMEAVVEHDEGDYDFTKSNWMDMEIKPKIAAKDKDLNPNDVGKEQFPDEYYCEVCNVRCTGSVTFKMHVEGNKHKLKVDKAASGKKSSVVPSNVKIVPCDKPSKIQEAFVSIDEPLIGLQYVTEFQKQDDKQAPKYVCNMCEAKCDGNSIISHVVGIKHKLHYFKEHYPEVYQKMIMYTSRKKSEQNSFAEEFARDIEFQEGRQEVKVKLEIDQSTELAAADLIKSGALDHLLEGTGITKDKLKNFDIESLKKTEQADSTIEKVKILPVIKNVEERKFSERLLPTKEERERLLPNRQPKDLLPSEKQEDEHVLPAKSDYSRMLPGRGADGHLSAGQIPGDRYPRRPEHEYLRPEVMGRGRYIEDHDMMRRRRLEDPYYARRGVHSDDPYYPPARYRDEGYPPAWHQEDIKLKPVLVMDYGHSNNPVEEVRTGLTEEERSFMKRKSDGPKTEEELFQEFLTWKKSRTSVEDSNQLPKPATTAPAVTPENYQIKPTSSVTPTQPVQMNPQPMDLPSYSTSDHSTSTQGVVAVQPAVTIKSSQVDLPPQVQELMNTLSKSMIHTEDEAAMALQVSNALTQALLQYQLKNLSKELQEKVNQQQQQQQQLLGILPGKADTKKPSTKKQRFDAYSMINEKTQKAQTTSKAVVSSTKSSVSNSSVDSKTRKSSVSVPNVQSTTQNINPEKVSSAQNKMAPFANTYPAQGGIVTSSQSAQGMVMSSQTMMTSPPVPGFMPTSAMNYTYQGSAGYPQYQQFEPVSTGYDLNAVQNVQPSMDWNRMFINQSMVPQMLPPPLPPSSHFQPPLPVEPPLDYPKPPPPPE